MRIRRRWLAAAAAVAWAGQAAAQEPAAREPAAPESTADAMSDHMGPDTPAEAAAPEPPPATPAPASAAAPAPAVSDAIAAGRLLLEVRARYETVDQKKTATLAENAHAYTIRTRIGWESADWNGFKGLIEFEDVRALFGQHFAVNAPGAATPPLNGANRAKYPLVNDPEVTELNRLQVAWAPNSAFSAVIGRQRILIDDQRFVGNVGWRQDEQTFDAARLDVAQGRFKGTYAYVTRVNRVLGELRDWESNSHLLNVTYSPAEALRVQGFVYALDFDNSLPNASITYGGRASGKTWFSLFQVAYEGAYARQKDWRGRTAPYGLDYWGANLAATFDIWTAKLAYESLEGDGVRGFTTPLATTHAFNGWSDAFAQALGGNKSFVDGLKDLNFSLNVKPRHRWTYLFNLDLLVRYHDFDDQRTGANLGREWNAQIQAAINPRLSAALKYADFERAAAVPPGTAAPPPSRTKVWFTLEYKL